MANKVKAAKKRVRKNDKSRFDRIVRHRQVLEREKYVEKALARTCNIYFICFILSVVLVVGTAIWVFVGSEASTALLGMNLAVGLVFAPLSIYQYNQYQHMAQEVAQARQASGFRFPEDYTPRTRQAREKVANAPSNYSMSTLLYGIGTAAAIVVAVYLFSTNAQLMRSTMSLLLAAAVIIVGVILFVMFLFNLLNYLDARALLKALIKIEEDAEVEFGYKRGQQTDADDGEDEEDDEEGSVVDDALDVTADAIEEAIEDEVEPVEKEA